jgi:hypothetical protein
VLQNDRKVLLDEIDFDWDPKEKVQKAVVDAHWESRFRELEAFQQQHGHCRVPKGNPLHSWIATQRMARYNTSTRGGRRLLSEEDISRLDGIGFVWIPRDENERWESMFDRLKKYKRTHGDCLVCKRDEEDEELNELGRWVQSQRQLKRKERLPQDREEKLDAIGFVWRVRDYGPQDQTKNDKKWKRNFKELCEFRKKNGHTLVPTATSLGTWVSHQRTLYKQNELNEDRKEMLELIDFIWSVDHYDAEKSMKAKRWEDLYNKLVAYAANFGHCDVPNNQVGQTAARNIYSWMDAPQ